MAKAKSLSFLSSFQICRSKDPSSMIKSPSSPAVSYMYSPVNSKTFDISFPSFPDPPPSTPCQSKSCTNKELTSYAYTKPRNEEKTCNSPISSDSDETDWRIAPTRAAKKKHKNARKKSKAGIRTSISSGDFDETDSLFSSPPSFNSSHHDFNHPLKTIYEEELLNGSKKPLKQKSARRFKRYDSREWKGGEHYENRQISGRLTPCMVDGKVNQSFVVVKRSVDPYKDFKKSMSEMIVEKQIFEPRELEQLLMSFLSLNSRLHHKVIIEAFTEVLKEVFSG